MGDRGPAPKPTAIKKLEGNPGKRPLPKHEPEFPSGAQCPDWLPVDAKTEWARVAPILERIRLLTQGDIAALSAYCLAWASLKDAQRMIDRDGAVVTGGSNGYVMAHPAVAIQNKAFNVIHRFCKEFGMTPSARGRMSLPGVPEPSDPMEDLLTSGPPVLEVVKSEDKDDDNV